MPIRPLIRTPVVLLMVLGLWLLAPPAAMAQTTEELAEIKAEMKLLREAYEARIGALEARIEQLETQAKEAPEELQEVPPVAPAAPEPVFRAPAPAPAPPISSGRGTVTGAAFNPAIGVLFNGRFTSFQRDPDTYRLPGFPLGREVGPGPEGFALDETELNFSSNVNDLFYASLTAALEAGDGEVEIDLEEAFIQTLALPGGLTIKAGRFFAALGYLNENHSHTDNFAVRPLPYQAFLAGQFNDDGVQVSIVLPTDLYVQLGGGIFRGADFPAGGAANGGAGAYTGFLRVGGDVGFSHSWRAGFSYLHADASGRESGPEAGGPADLLVFDGNSDLLIADFKYQWAPNGNTTERYFVLQGEYFRRTQDGSFNGVPYDGEDGGWYLEGIYKFKRGWRVGYRYSQLDPERNVPTALLGTGLEPLSGRPRAHSVMLDWARNDFSLLRVQFTRDLSGLRGDSRFYIQYIMSIGAHGAHKF